MPARRQGGGRPALAAAAAFVAAACLAAHLGVRFDVTPLTYFWQYLDREVLHRDLGRGIASLHAQPPLFNLFLGGVLKLAPADPAPVFAAAYAALALGLLLGLAALLRRLGVPDGPNAVATFAFALHPASLVYTHTLFYTLPVAALVVAAALALARFARHGRPAWAHAFAWLAGALVLTRSVYHPVWFAAAVGAAAVCAPPAYRRRLVVAAIAPLVLANLWYAKTWWQVGVYGPSWAGMHLANGWRLPAADARALADAGVLPEVWLRRPFMDPGRYRDLGYFAAGPAVNPALDAPYRSDGHPNFNHRDYARISRAMLRGDLALLAARPGAYADRVGRALAQLAEPGPTLLLVAYDPAGVRAYAVRVRRVVGSAVVVVGLVTAVLFGAAGARRGRRALRPVLAYATVTVVWVVLCTSLVEVGENDRMRWEIDALVVALAGGAFAAAVRRLSGRRAA